MDLNCTTPMPLRTCFVSNQKFFFIIAGSIICSTLYTSLQELLFRQTDFSASSWLTFITFFVYAMMGLLEMLLDGKLQLRQTNMAVYMGISGLSMLATYMTNAALQHIPYSVKIVTKSCRIVPVMLFSVVLQGATYSAQEASAAALLVFGVILFVKGDPIGDIPGEQPLHISGFSMLLFAVAVDAVVANLEERFLFRVTPAATRTEAITVLSACASAFSFFALIASGTGSLTLVSQPKLVNRQNIQRGYTGEVWDIHFHAQSSISNPKIWVIVIASAMAGYGAMSFMLVMISMYGVTTTEVVKTLRKTLNVIVSFLLFPKPLTWMHFLGALLVLCGLCQFSKRKVKAKATPKAADVEKELQYFTPTKGRRTSRSGISKV